MDGKGQNGLIALIVFTIIVLIALFIFVDFVTKDVESLSPPLEFQEDLERGSDLVVLSLTYVLIDVSEGYNIDVIAKVRNIGNKNAGESHTRIFILGPSGSTGGGERIIETPAIAAGQSVEVSTNYLLFPEGEYLTAGNADFHREIEESDEYNNHATLGVGIS
jgi:hypothetical protein